MKNIKPVILASGSPRRKKLLEEAGIKFKIAQSNFDEHFDTKLKPREVVEILSLGKAKAVYENNKESVIIAADTIVALKNVVLGKPINREDAKRMLSMLSGKTHSIITGFTIIDGKTIITKSEITKITMRKISNDEINKYIKTKEPYDKAGGYATQGWAKNVITKIDGDLSNAIGLPIDKVILELKKLGIKTP